MTADDLIEKLQLEPHPEGGAFREIHRSDMKLAHPLIEQWKSERCSLTAIYYLLKAGDFSAFHRVRSDEVWVAIGGGPLELHVITPQGEHRLHLLGHDFGAGQEALAAVPAQCWQGARPASGADYALCSCIVAPGFDFEDFAMPRRSELLAHFPDHRELITELTHG